MTRRLTMRASRAKLARHLALAREGVLPHIPPEDLKTILQLEARAPLRGGNADLQHSGLFGDGHKQGDLF